MGMAADDAGDPGGGEHLLPALPPYPADRMEAPPTPISPWQKNAASMAMAVLRDGGEVHLPVPLLVSEQTVLPQDSGEH
jgi:hypothetical protein